jgi:hypothetical protein
LAVLIILASVFDMTNLYKPSPEVKTPKVLEIFDVELKDVLKKPHWYNEKLIKVKGFYRLAFENSSLFIQPNFRDAIWIELLTSDTITYTLGNDIIKRTGDDFPQVKNIFNSVKYVEVIGLFDEKEKGHEGGYKGTLKDIVSFKILTKVDSIDFIDIN